MKTHQSLIVIASFLTVGGMLLFPSCKKQEPAYIPQSLTVAFPGTNLVHDLYYRIGYDARSLELLFSEEINPQTIHDALILEDQDGSRINAYNLEVSGKQIILHFSPDFFLGEGNSYLLTVTPSLQSINGNNMPSVRVFEFRTTISPLDLDWGLPGNDSIPRHSIAVISDIHMGDARATQGKYGWFGTNKEALESFLDYVKNGHDIRQLVIQGDMLDEWIIPFDVAPFDALAGIQNSRDYFISVSNSPVNSSIFDRLRSIATDTAIDLIYVPGNHDMLLTREILSEIIPGIQWRGNIPGLGSYLPVQEIIMEHGHRFDFFNCPQSLVNPGHILPPGFFISRLYAYGNALHPGLLREKMLEQQESLQFVAAWYVSIGYTLVHFEILPPPMDQSNILMTGMDGYTVPLSFNGTRDMYAASIETLWTTTQTTNIVPVQLSVLEGIWSGFDILPAAEKEYMEPSSQTKAYRVVSFGHSHDPMLLTYPEGSDYSSIYANSGSWVDEIQSSHKVRTFLVITPGSWSGSGLDVVRLYQFNPSTGSTHPGADFEAVLLAEENIHI